MQLLVWDRQFHTGLPELDAQHQGLVDVLNELHRTLFDPACPADRREGVLRRAFDRLMAYARAQFPIEEVLMQRHGLDEQHQALHRRQHEQFLLNLRTLWRERDRQPEVHGRLMGFLASWVGLHLLGTDPAMVHQLRQAEAGHLPTSPAEGATSGADKGLRAMLNLLGQVYGELAQRCSDLGQASTDLQVVEDQVHMLANRLEVHSRFDELLQVANRRYFEQRLSEEVARAYRREEALSLMLVELDFFPHYGDKLGLPAADACLQTVAQAVAQALKRTTDLVARYGSHRLVVLLPDTDRQGAMLAAQRVVDSVALLDLPHPESLVAPVVTASVGVAGWVPLGRDHGEVLLGAAEAALELARLAGGNRVGQG